MTAAAEKTEVEISTPAKIDPLDIFYERCRILAGRVATGELGFIDCVDLCWSSAEIAGTVDRVGVDLVQHVLAIALMDAAAEHLGAA